MSGCQMPADHHKFVIYGPMRDRNAHRGGHRYGTCHTWDHGHRYAGIDAREHFFISAREHERVSAFEADHELAGAGPLNHHLIDAVLGHGPPVRDLGGIDDFHGGRQLGEQFGWGEAIGDHDVGLSQQAAAAHGDEFGITRTATDERYPASLDV